MTRVHSPGGLTTSIQPPRAGIRRPPRRRLRRPAPAQLTPQELQIAQLAAGALEPRDRRASLPLTPHGRLAPLPGVPEARRDLARTAQRRARSGLARLALARIRNESALPPMWLRAPPTTLA